MTHFTEAILAASKARAAPLCAYNKRRATRLAAKSARPLRVGRIGAARLRSWVALRRLPDAWHRAAHRAYPGDPIRSHEMRHYQ